MLLEPSIKLGLPWGPHSKESACYAGDLGFLGGLGRSLEEGMGTHSSVLAWGISWTEEPSELSPCGLIELDTLRD